MLLFSVWWLLRFSVSFTHDYGMLKNGRDAGGLYELIEAALE